MKKLVGFLLKLFFRTKLLNWERLVFSGPTIILPNHLSFLDAIFLYAFLPGQVFFVINTEIAAKVKFFLNWIDYVAVDPLNPYSLKKLVGVIKQGRPVVLFPEGRITVTGGLMKIYSGVGFIALKTDASLYPIIFSGLQYSKFSRIKDKVKTRWFPDVTIYAASPFKVELEDDTSFKQQKRAINAKILAVMQEALFECRDKQRGANNLFDELLCAGDLHGMGKIMAEDIGGTISYRKAIIGSYILGKKFRELLPGEGTTGVLLPNSIGHVVTLFALFYSGKTPAILNFSAGVKNNLECSHTADVKTIITSRQFIDKAGFEDYIRQLAEEFRIIYLEDLKAEIGITAKIAGLMCYWLREKAVSQGKIILFTSGSESKPKGVILRHANILANINQASSVIDYTPRDKMLNALPIFHSFGLTAGTLLPVLEGLTVFLYPSPLHYKVIPELAYDRNITLLLGTPTFLLGYGKTAHPYDFHNVRYVLAGGEKLKNEVKNLWQEKFGIRILEGYGTTETAPVLAINTPLFYRAGTAGRFLPGIRWRLEAVPGISDGGNLLVKGPNVMEGYLLSGQGFTPIDEWYNCGDLVNVDEAGFVAVKTRLKRFAKVSGEMISLDAVEQAAEKAFGSNKNAAINVTDEKKGEKIILYTSEKNADRSKFREYLSRSGQSMLSLPAAIKAVDKLPLLGSGKVDYVSLKVLADQEANKDA